MSYNRPYRTQLVQIGQAYVGGFFASATSGNFPLASLWNPVGNTKTFDVYSISSSTTANVNFQGFIISSIPSGSAVTISNKLGGGPASTAQAFQGAGSRSGSLFYYGAGLANTTQNYFLIPDDCISIPPGFGIQITCDSSAGITALSTISWNER